jgi:DNA-binding beta-propeller fold protein YncE
LNFDGTDLWVINESNFTVMRVSTGDGKLLATWTGATFPRGILTAMGKVFIAGGADPGSLYIVDPTQPAGAVTTLTGSLGASPVHLAFDGSRIWTANNGSVSIITLNPVTVTTVTTGFSQLYGILYDGSNIWVTDLFNHTLLKLNTDGSIAQSIPVGTAPEIRCLMAQIYGYPVSGLTALLLYASKMLPEIRWPLPLCWQRLPATG